MAFASVSGLAQRPCRRRPRVTCTTSTPSPVSLPNSYDDIRVASARAVTAASAAGIPLQEVQFPAVPNLATAALNELLDANRAFAKSLLLQLRASLPSNRELSCLLPDAAEADLARKAWRDGLPAPTYALDAPPAGLDVALAANPGFNVSEWFALEKVGAKTLIILNADFDRIRSAYYPRIFYPGLWKAKKRFLEDFEETFYFKNLPDGGALLREFPGPWTVFYRPIVPRGRKDGPAPPPPPPPQIIWQGEDRPTFQDVQARLRQARTDDQLARAGRKLP